MLTPVVGALKTSEVLEDRPSVECCGREGEELAGGDGFSSYLGSIGRDIANDDRSVCR